MSVCPENHTASPSRGRAIQFPGYLQSMVQGLISWVRVDKARRVCNAFINDNHAHFISLTCDEAACAAL